MGDEQTSGGGLSEDSAEVNEPESGEGTKAAEVDWKAKSRAWERRAKAAQAAAEQNQAAAKRLAELEEAQKSDAQRAAERIQALEAQLAGYQAQEQSRQWAAQVAKTSGVPAELLRGGSLEEVEAHAEALQAVLHAKGRGPVVPNEGTGKARTGTPADAFTAFIEDKFRN